MAQSSIDVSGMTLEKAAAFLGIQAQLGHARVQQEKRAMHQGVSGALIGGGLGIGAGATQFRRI